MTTVLCHGVFDLLHIGHIEHLMEARTFGDKLIVSVVADAYVDKAKRPMIYPESVRLACLAALVCVDQVVLCEAEGPQEIIRRLRPDVYVRGDDYEGVRMPESDVLERLGIPVRITKPSGYPRTTEIVRKIFSLCNQHQWFA